MFPKAIVITGTPCVGKSTLAQKLSATINFSIISPDTLGKMLQITNKINIIYEGYDLSHPRYIKQFQKIYKDKVLFIFLLGSQTLLEHNKEQRIKKQATGEYQEINLLKLQNKIRQNISSISNVNYITFHINSTSDYKILDKFVVTLKTIQILSKKYPNPTTPLYHRNLYELFVAVLLSAQMHDKRLNTILPDFFKKYPNFKTIASAKISDLENALHSVNYYKTKSKHLHQSSVIIQKKYNGKIPQTMAELITLPGVGRKTANVILNEGIGKITGIVVDTHVKRVANRLWLTTAMQPKKVEEDLKLIVPKRYWKNFSLWLIFHGRNTCTAAKSKCNTCEISKICKHKLSALRGKN